MQTINHSIPTNDVLASLLPSTTEEPTIHETHQEIRDTHAFVAYDNDSLLLAHWSKNHEFYEEVIFEAEEKTALQTFLNSTKSTASSQLAFSMSRRQFIAGYNAGVRDARGEQFCHEQPLTDSEIMESIKILFEAYNKTKDEEGLEYSIGSLIGLFAAR